MRLLVAAGVGIVLAFEAVGCVVFSKQEEGCTDELRLYQVAVERDMPTPFSQVQKLSLEACVGSGTAARCETTQAVSGVLGGSTSDPSRLLRGTVTQNADGTTHLEAKIQINDSQAPTPTPVSLRATDGSGVRVLEASGQVHWLGAIDCHPPPLDDEI